MHQLAWIRLMVARHPWAYWVVVAAFAGAAGFAALQGMARVDAARRSWSESATVWVASTSVEPGQPIAAQRRAVPRRLVPAGAVVERPDTAVAHQHIESGEIITAADVAAMGAAGLIPPGWVAFAVPASVEHFAIGDHVSAYSGDQRIGAGLVVDTGASEVMVAVPEQAAPAMAAALLADAVALGLTTGP